MMEIKEFRDEYFFLSNYYEHPIVFNGTRYGSAEAAYQAQKAPHRARWFSVMNPDQAKRYGRQVVIRSDWEQVKDQVMYEVLKVKFAPGTELAQKLLDTGDAHLEEGNWWKDMYWGTYKGEGKNQLGKTLMRVREELRNNA